MGGGGWGEPMDLQGKRCEGATVLLYKRIITYYTHTHTHTHTSWMSLNVSRISVQSTV